MTIYFGLELDDLVFPQWQSTLGGVHRFGPHQLLTMLESHLGLIGPAANNEHLRIEQYRQALQWDLQKQQAPFYENSFLADQLAAATALLQMRDELLLAGWDFQADSDTPPRLKVLADIETFFTNNALPNNEAARLRLSPGFADRFHAVLQTLEFRQAPMQKIWLNEPRELLPAHFQKLLQLLENKGAKIQQLHQLATPADTDLGHFQQTLSSQNKKQNSPLRNDGSLLILRAKRETDAATFLARLFRRNAEFKPLCLIPEKNRALDNALIQEGLPSLGILSASLARPSLQILKLVSTFLWEPIDPYKILEFVSLSLKPLEEELARNIASQIAATPGMKGEGWQSMLTRYFEELTQRAQTDASIKPEQIRKQYNFWFERKRYPANKTVPRTEVIDIFDYLIRWAVQTFEDTGSKNKSLLVLSQQAQRISDLLAAIPEQESQLSHLELERIVRTIYEPSPVLFKAREVDHLQHLHHSSAIIGSVEALLWWNFTRNEPNYFFSRWYYPEREYLQKKSIKLWGPTDDNALLLWQRTRPVLHCQQQLLLVIPQQIDGTEVYPHPLHDELEAGFGKLGQITFNLDTQQGREAFAAHFELPEKEPLAWKQLGVPQPFLQIGHAEKMLRNEYETFTSLNALFYFPYQWVFRQKTKLRNSSILSIVGDVTLKGNLAHRFFELMLRQENIESWDRSQVEAWINKQAPFLLSREGAVLLMYGREPDRISFINRVKQSAWALVSMIQNNGWQVVATEQDLQGIFSGVEVKGKADLVLQRGNEFAILDLKWRGSSRRENLIRSEEDLQLVMYSRLLGEADDWAHTAYFIIEEGIIIARNQMAFREARAVSADADHIEINERIWAKMEETFRWRLKQLQDGDIEVRTASTLDDIELSYADQSWAELLEMPRGDAPFDDYRTLINLVD